MYICVIRLIEFFINLKLQISLVETIFIEAKQNNFIIKIQFSK